MTICDSPFCSVRKELIETGSGWLWWKVTMHSGEIHRVRLLETWVNMGAAGPYIKVCTEEEPNRTWRMDLTLVKDMRTEAD